MQRSTSTEVTAPTHAVKVTLLYAKGLPNGDLFGKSDGYVKFYVEGQSARSSVCPNTLDPVWSPPEHFDFKMSGNLKDQVLQLDVFDHDLIMRDDHLAFLKIPLADFVSTKQEKDVPVKEFVLELPKGVKAPYGKSMIGLKINVTELDSNERVLELWENETWVIGKGWCTQDGVLIHHRGRWSTEDGSASSDSFQDVAPKPPLGFQCEGWTFTVGKGDQDGWYYASTFAGPWYGESSKTSAVRRRRWEAVCKRPLTKKSSIFF